MTKLLNVLYLLMKRIILSLAVILITSCGTPLFQGNSVKKIKTTAYTHAEKDHRKYKKLTANGGTLKKNRTAAADWSVFPVGTVLAIDGKKYEITDYGSALVKSKNEIPVVDIYQPSFQDMNNWGVRFFENVAVVKWGDYRESADILRSRLNYPHCKTMYNRIQEKL